MKFGLFYLPTYLPEARDTHTMYRDIEEQVVFADKIGIEYAWMVEHHFVRHGGLMAGNWALLTHLAARTERIRLGTGATVLPLNDPLRVAELAATVDHLSEGRFDLGVGRGFLREEFDVFGVEMRDSRERVEEGIELIKQAWTEDVVNWSGKFRPDVTNMSVIPKPFQDPHPPIWNACFLSPESFDWTAREGYDLLYVAYHVDPPVANERIGWYLEALPKHGRRVEDHEVCTVYHAFFQAEDDIDALRDSIEKPMAEYSIAGSEASQAAPDPEAYKGYTAREDYHNQIAFETYFPGRVLMGGPDRVIERLIEMKAAGITQVGLLVDYGSLSQDQIMESLHVFEEKVLPRVRELEADGTL